MRLRSILAPLLMIVAGCGDDGTSGPPRIEGRWAGQFFLASSLQCSDGGGVTIGTPTPTRVVTFNFQGGAALGDFVAAQYAFCAYEGRRDTNDFIRLEGKASNATDGTCGRRLELSEIRDGDAHLFLVVGPRPPPPGDGTVACNASEEADVRRDDGEGEVLVEDLQRHHLGRLQRPEFEIPEPEGVQRQYGFTLDTFPTSATLEIEVFEVNDVGAVVVLNDQIILEMPRSPGTQTLTAQIPRTLFRIGANVLTIASQQTGGGTETLAEDFEYENLRVHARFFIE